MATWTGAYMDGERASRTRVSVDLTRGGVRLTFPDGDTTLWRYEAIAVASGYEPGEPATLTCPSGERLARLEIAQVGFLDALAAQAPPGQFRKPGSARTMTALAVGLLVGTVTLFSGLWVWGLPWLANEVVRFVPPDSEERIGRAIMDGCAREAPACKDPRKVGAVQQIVDRLLAGTGTPYRYRVLLLHGEAVNAMAAPGGNVVVYEGLLAKLPTPEALAGVLAHEVEHVERRHVSRAMIRDFAGALLTMGLLGDSSGLSEVFGAVDTLGDLALTRADEDEADRLGLARIHRARIDPRGTIAAFEVLIREHPLSAREERALRYLSDHPPTRERLAVLRSLMRHDPLRIEPLRLATPWMDLARPCKR